MRRTMISISILAVLSSHDLLASAKTDSIVTFLGGAHAKFVWFRWAWCNDDYTPKTQAAATAAGYSLMLMDTRNGYGADTLNRPGPGRFLRPNLPVGQVGHLHRRQREENLHCGLDGK